MQGGFRCLRVCLYSFQLSVTVIISFSDVRVSKCFFGTNYTRYKLRIWCGKMTKNEKRTSQVFFKRWMGANCKPAMISITALKLFKELHSYKSKNEYRLHCLSIMK